MNALMDSLKSSSWVPIASAIVIGFGTFKVAKSIYGRWRANRIHNRILNKIRIYLDNRRKQIEDFLEKEAKEISEDERTAILESSSSIATLSQKIRKGIFTVRQVVIAFLIRSVTIGEKFHNLADLNISEVLKLANLRDEEYKMTDNKELLPALFGIPFSIKENIQIENFRSTFGYGDQVDVQDTYDALVVSSLKKLGAIPLIKSNVPMGYMSFKSINNIYGLSVNPWNPETVTGGSSGGEAGLVSSYCSMVGIGSDLGGSIRIPSSFCGLYGIKPCYNKISKIGSIGFNRKDYWVIGEKASYGPMARNIDDLIFTCQHLWGTFPEDKYACQLKFDMELFNDYRSEKPSKRVKLGYFYDLDYIETAPGIKSKMINVIEELKNKFNNKYDIVPYTIEDYLINKPNDGSVDPCLLSIGFVELFNQGFFQTIKKSANGEKLVDFYDEIEFLLSLGGFKKKALEIITRINGEKRMSQSLKEFEVIDSMNVMLELRERIAKASSEFFAKMKKEGIEGFILPNSPLPAYKTDCYVVTNTFFKYTYLFNLLDLPSCSVPIGFLEDTSYVAKQKDSITNAIEKSLNISKGLPISMQVATISDKEELLLSIVKDIDSITRFSEVGSPKILEKLNS